MRVKIDLRKHYHSFYIRFFGQARPIRYEYALQGGAFLNFADRNTYNYVGGKYTIEVEMNINTCQTETMARWWMAFDGTFKSMLLMYVETTLEHFPDRPITKIMDDFYTKYDIDDKSFQRDRAYKIWQRHKDNLEESQHDGRQDRLPDDF